ncbi:MAG: MFS transporter [Polyangiaceae bacterium]
MTSPNHPAASAPGAFSPYQKFVVALLAFLQFTIVLDFMIMGPLGALLLRDLGVSTEQFGKVVSVYAFSAGASGLLAAGFADRFDRKKLLLFFYAGFLLGTFLCGVATSYEFLLVARIVTGLFGGVIGSISMAIVADLFPLEVRGRVMGTVQTAFAASQVLGIPLGVLLSNKWGWHAPFLMIVAISTAVGALIVIKLQPIDAHLKLKQKPQDPFAHVKKTVSQGRYLRTFAATALLATGGFMLMPFGSAFSVNNLGVSLKDLTWVYLVTGIFTFMAGPLLGRVADRIGKYRMFAIGSTVGMVLVWYFCRLSVTPLWLVMVLNTILFVSITSRMISAQALISAVPDMPDRGAFMAVNSSLQQLSGGIAAWVAGHIVVQTASGRLEHYDTLGSVVVCAMAATVALMYPIHRAITRKRPQAGPAPAAAPVAPASAPAVD